jgi:cytochrome c553
VLLTMLSLYSRLRAGSQAALAACLFAAIMSQPAAAQGDAAQGKILADTCRGCHAVESYTNVYPTYHVPRIAGQSADYLVNALKLYRDGDRKHPTMVAQASSFSDEQIQDIAAWISSSGPQLEASAADMQLPASAPAAAQVCAACHGPAGISSIPTNPHLAGQQLDYIQHALSQYKSGDRKGPNAIAMQAQLTTVSDEDLDEIAAYYASQDGIESLPSD